MQWGLLGSGKAGEWSLEVLFGENGEHMRQPAPLCLPIPIYLQWLACLQLIGRLSMVFSRDLVVVGGDDDDDDDSFSTRIVNQ